jgi:nitrite reductase (NADH) small subunit
MTGTANEWIDIGALGDIPRRGSRVVKTAMGCVAVFRTGSDEVFALENRCPHKGGPLSEGIVHGNKVTCPLHNWVFSLETGEAQGADKGTVPTYPARIEDGRILLETTFLQSRMAAE